MEKKVLKRVVENETLLYAEKIHEMKMTLSLYVI